MTLAIFDLDNTLINGDSDHAWGQFLINESLVDHAEMEPMMLPDAEQLIETHRQQGDTLLIITATNQFVTEPIAQRLGINHLIACEPELKNGRYTGKPTGIPSFQHGKVERLDMWLKEQQQSLAGAWFYSDSHNDLPLLERVDNPVAVNPDDRLRKRAQEQGWAILDLRKNT